MVVAACSPRMHEPTFRRTAVEGGLNPYLCEMANLREHCSWVHEKGEPTTAKAIDLVRMQVEKVKRNQPLTPIRVPITKKALVLGGGIAGIQAALDIANAGSPVLLVEKSPSIGGHMSQLSETFPTLDCSQCILTPRMVEVARHPNITLYTYSELEKLEGFIGNFKATIRKKARKIDEKLCNGCGVCQQKCPVKKIPDAVQRGPVQPRRHLRALPPGRAQQAGHRPRQLHLITRPANARPARSCARPRPSASTRRTNRSARRGRRGPGHRLQDHAASSNFPEYGYGKYKDVIDGMKFERLASASGPTGGAIKRPSDGKAPETIVFIACAGSRDRLKGVPYCSKICCMYTAKHAMLYQHKVHGGKATIFYMDIRSAGKNYDEFVRRAIEEDGVKYMRGRVSRVYEDNGQAGGEGRGHVAWRPSRSRSEPTWWCWPPPCKHKTALKNWRRRCMCPTTRTNFSPKPTPSCGQWKPTRQAFSWPAPARPRATFLKPLHRPVVPRSKSLDCSRSPN